MLGRLVVRRPAWVVAAAVLVAVLAGVIGAGTLNVLSLNRFEAPGSESMRARDALAREFHTGTPNVALLLTAKQGTVDSPEAVAAGQQLTRELAAYPGVGDAWSYWARGGSATLRSGDARQAMVLAWVPGDANEVRRDVLPELAPRFGRETAAVRVEVGGADEVFRNVMEQARRDFVRAELIVLPVVALLLLWVFRRISAALITLGIGLFAVVGSLAILRGVVAFTDVSTFASNIALMMGIGLGVDYGLFVIFRFREELRAGYEVPDAVTRTVRSAGRTVLFSGVTVAASLSVLLAFPFPFLRSFGYAGIAVVRGRSGSRHRPSGTPWQGASCGARCCSAERRWPSCCSSVRRSSACVSGCPTTACCPLRLRCARCTTRSGSASRRRRPTRSRWSRRRRTPPPRGRTLRGCRGSTAWSGSTRQPDPLWTVRRSRCRRAPASPVGPAPGCR